MKQLPQFMERLTSRSRLIALFAFVVVALVSVHVVNTPWSLVRLRSISGGPVILDMEFHYNAQHAQELLTAIGPAGRSFYLWRMLGALDIVLPAIFAAFLLVAMSMAFRGVVAKESPLRALQWLPLAALALDYTENVLIASLLLTFPVHHPLVAAIAGWTTSAKTIAYATNVVVCLCALVMRALNAMRRNASRPLP